MLLPYTTLTYHGPGAGAAIEPPNQPGAAATLKGLARLVAVHTTAPTALARINDGRQLRAVHTTAPTAHARPSGKGRLRAIGKVNELSQDDVTGAVLEAFVEDDLTVKGALRYLIAVAQGDATGLESGTPAFKSLDGTKTRIGGTYVGGARTVTTRDPS